MQKNNKKNKNKQSNERTKEENIFALEKLHDGLAALVSAISEEENLFKHLSTAIPFTSHFCLHPCEFVDFYLMDRMDHEVFKICFSYILFSLLAITKHFFLRC